MIIMNPKILLVDDRDDNLMSIEAILTPDNYNLVKANSGRQALKILLQEYDFALILMDVQMPNLNGFETASLIYEREKLRHIPIIFSMGTAPVLSITSTNRLTRICFALKFQCSLNYTAKHTS